MAAKGTVLVVLAIVCALAAVYGLIYHIASRKGDDG